MTKNKTGFLVFMLFITSALLIESCKKTDIPRDSATITLPSAVTLSNDGSSTQVELVLSNDDAWSIAKTNPDATWCTIVPTSGQGSAKLIVTASANEERLPQSVEIIVTSNQSTARMIIHQKDSLNVTSESNIIVSNQGETRTMEVEANTLWEVIKADSRASWVQFTPAHGAGKGSVQFTILPNQLLSNRSTEIIFSAGNATRVITILQQNIPEATSKTDSLALVALYNATDGKGWSSAWNLTLPIATWKGVTLTEVEGQTRVTALRLPGRGLDGTIPLEMGNLTCLKALDLSSNSIKGDLPEEIANLTQLEELNLATNKFVGVISKNITKLINLRTLDLQNNRFNLFPVEICQLQQLEYVHLAKNELNSLPGEISQMSNLKFLYLDNNQLTELPKGLEKTPNLEYLHASNNQITGLLPQAIGEMHNLISLRLEYNNLSGAIPSNFSHLANLKYLYLSNNKLSGSLPDMSNLKKLIVLSVSQNELSGNLPDFGKDGLLVSLERIELANNQLSGELTENLRYMTSLAELYVSSNLLTGTLPAEALAARTNNYPTFPSWETMLYLPNLRAFAVDDNYMTGNLPANLAHRLDQSNPAFNTSQFRVNNNCLTGMIPREFKGNYGSMPGRFNFAQNVYPQRNGVVLELAN